MAILAMTQFESWVHFASFIACIVLMVHAIVPNLSKNRQRVKPRIWSLFLRAAIEFISLWIWLFFSLGIWIFLGGGDDLGLGLYDFAKDISARVAIVVVLIAYIRIYWKGTTVGYLRFRLCISLILLLSFATVCVI